MLIIEAIGRRGNFLDRVVETLGSALYCSSMTVVVEMHHTGTAPDVRADVVAVIEHALADAPGEWRVWIAGSQANDQWEMKITGPNGFERSYTLEGTAGEHAPHAIGNIVRRLGKSRVVVQQALDEIEGVLPFRLLGVDSDNGSEFINCHLKRWCEQKQIQLTRGRPYKKDDNAHVEQKNWTHVRKLLRWERYDSGAAAEAINDLCRHELRLWMNLYLPSVKLVKKVRVGSKVRRVYDAAQTPMERVLAGAQAKPERVAELKRLRQSLDPFQLGKLIDQKLQIYDLANWRLSPKVTAENRAAQAKAKTLRGRRDGLTRPCQRNSPRHA
jgi:hypothetical protein